MTRLYTEPALGLVDSPGRLGPASQQSTYPYVGGRWALSPLFYAAWLYPPRLSSSPVRFYRLEDWTVVNVLDDIFCDDVWCLFGEQLDGLRFQSICQLTVG